MKSIKIFYIVLSLLLFASGNLSAQYFRWYPVNSGTTQKLNFISSSYILGNSGTILKRNADTVSPWIPVSSGTNSNLYSLRQPGETYISGSNGTILRIMSSNPLTFQIINTGINGNLLGIAVTALSTSSIRYMAVGENGLLLYSSNGTFWTQQTSFTTDNFYCIRAARGKAWIGSDNGKIYMTTNMGNNWNIVNTGFTGSIKTLFMNYPYDSLSIHAVGTNGLAIKSTNGGLNWTSLNVPTTANLNGINFLFYGSKVYGYVCGDNGTIFRTNDSGKTWQPQISNTSQNLYGVVALDTSTAYAVGDNGTIIQRKVDPLYNPLRSFTPNNINTLIKTSGIFNQNTDRQNQAGFEWPEGSGKFLLFTSGLTIAAKVNNELRMMAGSYRGECFPGYVNSSGQFETNDDMKIYRVSKTDNPNINPDWMNWGLMVPFGAPYIDVNNNFQYEPFIDTPGVRNASQTIFCVMTDANPRSHSSGEGFGGGTEPLNAEIRLTAWGYNFDPLKDVVFYKWDITNKSSYNWDSTFFMIFNDPDIGDAVDDYIGSDTTRDLYYSYNADNIDNDYGTSPPAVGTMFLKTPGNLGMMSTNFIFNSSSSLPCESDPNGEPQGAYNYIKGFKKDLSPWVIPRTNPVQTTKYVYSGDPETNQGWNEANGRVENCGGINGVVINVNPPGDRRQMMSTGNLVIQPNHTIIVTIAQLVARGTSNLNSVTKLKAYADQIKSFYSTIPVEDISGRVPNSYALFQNYPNPFNPNTTISFNLPRAEFVKLRVFDITGREIAVLLNQQMDLGAYKINWNAARFSSGVYFYQLETANFTDTKKMVLLK